MSDNSEKSSDKYPKIKMCGMKKGDDIKLANEFMPEYVGFVFAEFSSRYISYETAEYLKYVLSPDILSVGVFVNEDREKVVKAAKKGIIDMVQLHGSESEDEIRYIQRKTGKPVIKAFRMPKSADGDMSGLDSLIEEVKASPADYVLIDSGMGSGKTFDWSLLDGIDREYFLAGGLSPVNVAEAVTGLHPFAVDVSSGIEKDGVKDRELMEAFVKAVRG